MKVNGKVSHSCMRSIVHSLLLLLIISQPLMAAALELSLEDSVAMALATNADIKIAENSREKARWELQQVKADKKLTVNFSHTDTHYNTPVTVNEQSSSNLFSNQLTLSLPVYSGGKLEKKIEQAGLAFEVAELALTAAKQQLRQNVITYYYDVQQYRNEVKVNQETVANYAAHLELVESQYHAGTVAKAEMLASQVELANAQDDLSLAQNNYDLAVAKLNNLIGLPLDSQPTLTQELKYEKYPSTLEECSQYALANRPEVRSYQAKIDSAVAEVGIAQSGYSPTVDFSLSQSWSDRNFPGADNSDWQATLTTSLNLFDSGINKSKVKQADYALATAKESARQQQDTILLEVREAYLSLHEAEKRIETKKVAVAQAEESLMIAEARYRLGAGTNLAVFDAVVALNTAKLNGNKALYDYNTSKAQLEKAMGIAIAEK